MITPVFKIKLSYYVREILNSYSSQCICLFGNLYFTIYGKKLYIYNVFYQPHTLKSKISVKYIVQLNKILTKINGSCILFNQFYKKSNIQHVKIVTCISRIISPKLDSHIMSQYIKLISASYNFNQICNKMTQKMIFRPGSLVQESSSSDQENKIKNVNQEYHHNFDYSTNGQVQGLIIKIHGRTPKEPVRPRKTIQYRILGQSTGTGAHNFNTFKPFTMPVTGINPELGTFSVWVQCIV